MADKTVVVRYVGRGGSQVVGQQMLIAKGGQRMAAQLAASQATVAASSRNVGAMSAVAGKMILFGVGAAMAVSAKAAMDFESSMAGVFKTLGDSATASQIDALGESLRKMSLGTPVNVNELAGIAEIGGQLGVGIEDMEKFVETIAALGVTTNLSTADAAKGLARFSNIMEIPLSDVDQLGNILVELGNNFATTESEILNFALRLAPVGKTVGATSAEIFGLATAFSSLGIPAERGATAIQRVFIDIARAVDAGGEKLEKFALVAGMTSEAFTDLGATDRFSVFVAGLRRIQEEGGSAFEALDTLNISQQRTIQVLLAAAGANETFADAVATANKEAQDGNALYEEAARRYGTTASQVQLMVNAFNDLRIEIGGPLLGGLQTMINFLKDLFTAMKDNVPLIRTFAKILLGIVAAKLFLGFMLGIGKAVTGVIAFGQAIKAVNAANAATGVLTLAAGIKGITGLLGVLNVALSAAVIGFGAYFLWQQNNERKARDLAEAVQVVNDSLEEGVPPAEAWSTQVRNMISLDEVDLLARAGISINDISDSLNQVPGTLPLDDILHDLEILSDPIKFSLLQKSGTDLGFLTDLGDDFVSITDAMDLNLDEDMQTQIIAAADAYKHLKKLRIQFGETGLDWARRLRQKELDGRGEGRRDQKEMLDAQNAAQREGFVVGFRDQVEFNEDTAKAWDDFTETSGDALDEYESNVADAFGAIFDTLTAGMGMWDTYEGAVDLSLADAQAAMNLRLADARAWVTTYRTILEWNPSDPVLGIIEGTTLAERAALTKAMKDTPEALRLYFEQLGMDINELSLLAAQELALSGALEEEMDAAILAIIAGAEEFATNTGLDPFVAFTTLVGDIFELAGPEWETAFVEALAYLQSQGVVDAGYDAGSEIVTGVTASINDKKVQARIAGQNLMEGARLGILSKKDAIEAAVAFVSQGAVTTLDRYWKNRSPSKVAYGIGENVGEGFRLGMMDKMTIDPGMMRNHVGGFRQAAFGPTDMSGNRGRGDNNTEYNLNVHGSKDPAADGRSVLLTAQMIGNF